MKSVLIPYSFRIDTVLEGNMRRAIICPLDPEISASSLEFRSCGPLIFAAGECRAAPASPPLLNCLRQPKSRQSLFQTRFFAQLPPRMKESLFLPSPNFRLTIIYASGKHEFNTHREVNHGYYIANGKSIFYCPALRFADRGQGCRVQGLAPGNARPGRNPLTPQPARSMTWIKLLLSSRLTFLRIA